MLKNIKGRPQWSPSKYQHWDLKPKNALSPGNRISKNADEWVVAPTGPFGSSAAAYV